MAQYQITKIFELLHHLFKKNTKDSGIEQILESVLNQILQTLTIQATRIWNWLSVWEELFLNSPHTCQDPPYPG